MNRHLAPAIWDAAYAAAHVAETAKLHERLAGIPEDDWQTDKEAARLAETLSNIEAADVA